MTIDDVLGAKLETGRLVPTAVENWDVRETVRKTYAVVKTRAA